MSGSCNPKECSPAGSSLQGISQAMECIPFSRESSWPRDQTHVSCIGRQMLYHCATWEAQQTSLGTHFHFVHFHKLGCVNQEFWKFSRVQLDSEGRSVDLCEWHQELGPLCTGVPRGRLEEFSCEQRSYPEAERFLVWPCACPVIQPWASWEKGPSVCAHLWFSSAAPRLYLCACLFDSFNSDAHI